jgi:molecular chaperone GrpE
MGQAGQPNEHEQEKRLTSSATLEDCQAQLTEARREIGELRDKYLRTAAEVENARKWAERDTLARAMESKRDLLRQFLEVMDNLERALAQPAELAALRKGVEITRRQFEQVLAQTGVERIAIQPGQAFDPLYHQAVGIRSGEVSEETVAEVVQSGYLHDGAVLRPARVIVMRPG